MLFRGGMDGLMIRAQLTFPETTYLNAEHYNGIFTTHGTVMILFMAMPFVMGLMNLVVPLQIGARDVAYPFLNALSFWLFFVGAMLFNIAFVIGGSPDAGWTSYFPMAGTEFTSGVGNNYYAIALQISGLGTLMTGINFLVTILKNAYTWYDFNENANVYLVNLNYNDYHYFRFPSINSCSCINDI